MSDLKWNLDKIYTGVDSPEFKQDLSDYEKALKQMNCWCENNLKGDYSSEITQEYIIRKNNLLKYEKLDIYCQLALSVDTSAFAVAKALDFIENISTLNALHEALFTNYIKNYKEDKTSEILSEHSYFLNQTYKDAVHTLSPKEEMIISKMKATGSVAWQKQWENLTSNLEVEINGETESLSTVRNYAYSQDKALRKTAYEAELKAYEKINTAGAYSLNSIKGQVINEAEIRGYENPLDMTLNFSGIDKKILDTMLEAIKEKTYIFEKYFVKKAEMLGYKNGLPFFELFAPMGKNNLSFSVEEAKETVLKGFETFSTELMEFAKNAFENRWVDFMPGKGKVGGAFCSAVHCIGESRIMTNFGGTFNDVVTIAHELGHGYHDSKLNQNTPLNSGYPMPIAETASTFCETIINNYMLDKVDKETKIFILENDIQGIAQTIIDIYSRFIFEHSFFEERKKGSLSVDEINELMLSAQKQAYGKGLDESCLHPYMWLCKPHYYDSEYNYYNFPYAFGALLSRGFYSKFVQDKEGFVPLYNKMLTATGTNDIKDVAKIADVDLYDKSFWLSGLESFEEEINQLFEL